MARVRLTGEALGDQSAQSQQVWLAASIGASHGQGRKEKAAWSLGGGSSACVNLVICWPRSAPED